MKVTTSMLQFFPIIREGQNENLIFESEKGRIWKSKEKINGKKYRYYIELTPDAWETSEIVDIIETY